MPVDANHSLRSSSGQPRTPQLRWEWVLSQNRPALILETAGAPAMQEPGAPKIQLSIRSIDQRTGQDRDPTHIEATQVRPAAALSPSCWPLALLFSITSAKWVPHALCAAPVPPWACVALLLQALATAMVQCRQARCCSVTVC